MSAGMLVDGLMSRIMSVLLGVRWRVGFRLVVCWMGETRTEGCADLRGGGTRLQGARGGRKRERERQTERDREKKESERQREKCIYIPVERWKQCQVTGTPAPGK
jgi:hypothetical protein